MKNLTKMKIPIINSRLKSYFLNGFLVSLLVYISAGALFILLPILFNLRILKDFKKGKVYFFVISIFITLLAIFQVYYIDSIQQIYSCLRFGSTQFSLGNNAFVLIVLSAMLWEVSIYFKERKIQTN
ncbi:MAG: hypothetical protein COZ18_11170 [Flexibacter sp. CG_4_10_14_3_um_filter_32_15]|nr:MAG: hypothetical protein COZ18_11170 [Flexibacter sp. CG_4_10_14_3_um_filter_32_15]